MIVANAPFQLPLPLARDGESLRLILEGMSGRPVHLTVTGNAVSMLSVRNVMGSVRVRLHRMFLSADNGVIREIASVINTRKARTPLIRAFIRANQGSLSGVTPRKTCLSPSGQHHDLATLFSEVNAEYFGGRISSLITWGTMKRGRQVRMRTLGSFSERSKIIRISPLLDRGVVPRYFLKYVVYHEMLHADIIMREGRQRGAVHTREFKERERMFREYTEALAWEKAHFGGRRSRSRGS